MGAMAATEPSEPPPAARRRGRPPRLKRSAILASALQLVDSEGAQALTMRRLGSELGVEAMSLYRHVASKDAVLDGIAELLIAEVQSAGGSDWPTSIRRFATGIRTVARAHPAAFELAGTRVMHTHSALGPVDALLAALRAGGFAPTRAVATYRLVASYARGFALIEIAGFTLASPPPERDPDSPDDLPAIRALARPLASEPTDAQFRAGIETIITGLRAELG
jgi:AcrR family transcriptional regulator